MIANETSEYLHSKSKLDPELQAKVENNPKLSRATQLSAYDNVAKLRPIWDQIASQYDAILTPSAIDEAPLGINSTGDAVSSVIRLSLYFIFKSGTNEEEANIWNKSPFVECGQFFMLQLLIFPVLREQMECQLA